MNRTRAFQRFGMAYMPCTFVGWVYLFALIIFALTIGFLVQELWAKTGWPGAGMVNFATLTLCVVVITRFAHKRSA
jgi:hypothetical protein